MINYLFKNDLWVLNMNSMRSHNGSLNIHSFFKPTKRTRWLAHSSLGVIIELVVNVGFTVLVFFILLKNKDARTMECVTEKINSHYYPYSKDVHIFNWVDKHIWIRTTWK